MTNEEIKAKIESLEKDLEFEKKQIHWYRYNTANGGYSKRCYAEMEADKLQAEIEKLKSQILPPQ